LGLFLLNSYERKQRKQIIFTPKELRYLWQAIFLEKEMGKELG
jgi:hypothetical protein